ncbi:glycosyltransferase [Vibrio hannami]|uniref:glycosyltransferase n=1 Tax=Vibrio hannami TaxID=2717094 RepID=UPI00240F55A9|nr:glycosyltransferase [Vibrio hannami]MDG3086916.1 glycosyltransferase [Vibrio hannami]
MLIMKVSLIVAVYKDYQALSLILQQLEDQTYKNFEVVIAEDARSSEIIALLKKFPNLDIKHCSQEDSGIRKMQSQNNAIKAATGDYLVFVDGDCVPYPTFIEYHVQQAKPGYVSSGRRVNLGPKFSDWLRKEKVKASTIANNFLLFFVPLLIDGKEGHIESGFTFKPDGWIYKNILNKSSRTTSLLGCNFGCFKKDIVAINGFDESYGETAVGDDTDIEWRFIAYGLKVQSVKNTANVFHLYHPKRSHHIPYYDEMIELMLSRKEAKKYFASKGLSNRS